MTETGPVFAELMALMTQAAEGFTEGPRSVADPQSRAEGYRWATDVLSVAIDCFVKADPTRPELTPIVSPTRKFGGDNRDARYHHARLDPELTYRVTGRTTQSAYLALTVYGGPDDGHWTNRIVGTFNDRQMEIDDDGTFDVVLSATEHPGNWLRLDPDAVDLVTRDYLADIDTHRPTDWSIAVEGERPPALRLTDADEAVRWRRAVNFCTDMFTLFPLTFDPQNANQLDEPYAQPPATYGWAAGDAAYCMGWFELADGEALVIEGTSPPCAFWNLCLWNPYLQTYDYRQERVTLNGADAVTEPNGSWRIVLAATDPGTPNWLSTAGHEQGLLWFRWFLAESVPDRPSCTVSPPGSW